MTYSATGTDVADYLGLDAGIPASASDRVDRLIAKAEDAVAGELPGFTFGATSAGTVTVYGDGDDYLLLPYYPASNVTACTVGGTVVDVAELAVDSLGRLRRYSGDTNNPHRTEGARSRWPDDGVAVVVTYDYGVGSASACPPEVAAVVVELVAVRYTNPDGIVQESLGDRSRMFSQSSSSAGLELSAGQLRRLRNWRRNRVASARMRA